MSFIFGGDTRMTYEQMLQARNAAEQAKQSFQRPQNVGEGWGSIFANVGAGLATRAANKAEAEGRENASEKYGRETSSGFADLYGQRLRGGANMSSMGRGSQGVRNSSKAAHGGPTSAAADGMKIRQGLIDRGLPEHVADGFVMNFRDESGLNPGVNEQAPIVPGSRGGFGLAQWTGPRRRQLEIFAEQRGVPVSDPDLQMDFLMTELQGSERGAGKVIMSTSDAGSAGAAIVNEFLRPAEEHRSRRTAQYTGGGGSSGPSASLLDAMQDPYMSEGQRSVLGMLLQQQMAASQPPDPMQALQMEKAQLEIEGMRNPAPDQTSAQQNYEYMVQQGIDPQMAMERAFGSGGTNVTVNNAGEPAGKPLGTEGNVLVPDPTADGGFRVVQAEGSDAALERQQAAEKAGVAQSNAGIASDTITSAAQRAREAAGERTFGGLAGRALAYDPSTRNAEVYRQAEVLKSNAKIENLTAMRAASPTGGALGSVTEKESQMLAEKSGALDPASPNFLRDLDDYERTLLRVVHGKEAGDALFEQSRPQGPDTEPPAGGGQWNGPSIDEVRQMDPMTINSMLNAYEGKMDLIPDDVLQAIIEKAE